MGSQFEFTCDGCGYRADVAGEKDEGMMAVFQTMTCHDSKNLVDVLIGQYGEEGPIGRIGRIASAGLPSPASASPFAGSADAPPPELSYLSALTPPP